MSQWKAVMDKLHLGLEIRDFDLERLGFSLSVLDKTKRRQASEAYLRMTLIEFHAFLKALRAADENIDLSTAEPPAVRKLPSAPMPVVATAKPES